MPLTLANPDRRQRQRAPVPVPSRNNSSGSESPPLTEIQSTSVADRLSLHSFVSSSEHTAVSDHAKTSSHYLDDRSSIYKALPTIPLARDSLYNQKLRRSEDYDPQLAHHSGIYTSEPTTITNIHPITSIAQLTSALGADNVPYTTEIATIPCAGVRIVHGPLTGLLAWRLVVSDPSPVKTPRRSWWGSGDATRRKMTDHHVNSDPTLKMYSKSCADLKNTEAAASAASLPMKQGAFNQAREADGMHIVARPQSVMADFGPTYFQAAENMHHSRSGSANQPPHPVIHGLVNRAVATNFILDTSLPYSIISRDTLEALGYSPQYFPSPHANPHTLEYNDTEDSKNSGLIVSLSIQGVTTRVRIARPGEASRLGVQYLRDAGISVFFPSDGDGVGPVLYYESARLLRDIPLTIPNHGRPSKPTLPQRVRALFGLS